MRDLGVIGCKLGSPKSWYGLLVLHCASTRRSANQPFEDIMRKAHSRKLRMSTRSWYEDGERGGALEQMISIACYCITGLLLRKGDEASITLVAMTKSDQWVSCGIMSTYDSLAIQVILIIRFRLTETEIWLDLPQCGRTMHFS